MREMKKEREQLVEHLKNTGIITSPAVEKAMLSVRREMFVPEDHRQNAYADEPLPIPPFTGDQTISAPHTYPLFYQPLELMKGDGVLEIGTGSGYGAALAAEIVGQENVVTIENTKETVEFAKQNLEQAGYTEITVVHGDGSGGYPKKMPYKKIIVTASHEEIPPPLLNQLAGGGKLVFPRGPRWQSQDLVMIEKNRKKIKETFLGGVAYVPLKGEHGYKK